MAPNNGIKVGDSNNSHRSNIDSTPPSSNNSSNNNLVEEQEGLYVEAPPSQPILPPPSLRRGCCGCPPVRHVKHAPAFQHVPHIKLGYRVGFSVRNCLVSVFTFHNESINIWSHLSGTVYVLYALSCFLRMDGLHVNIDDSEYKAILTFLLCAVACLSFSTCYHTFGCMSENMFKLLLRVDLIGIALLIWGSYVPGIHYAFACFPRWQRVYHFLTLLLLLLGLGGAALTDTHCPRQSLVRTGTFALLVTFGLVPSLHWCMLVPAHVRAIFLDNLIGMFSSYSLGFCLWASRFPERFFPQTPLLGLWFSSHQLWHMCIFMAVKIWLAGILEMHMALHEMGCELLS
ncbi:progestin and adipoq receptor family member iiia [Nannochloropsis oceanica]